MTDSTSSIARFSYLPSSPTTGDWIDTQALPSNYKDAQHWLNGFRAELSVSSTAITYGLEFPNGNTY